MPRWLVTLVIAILLPCYGFAAAGKAVVLMAASGDEYHAMAHLTDHAHHHDDDGAMHEDDSDASLQHVHGDDWLASPVLTPAAPVVPAPWAFHDSPPPYALISVPRPVLDGPMRPPRSDAI